MAKSKMEIMDKIKKCLELTKSDNEHEAFSAMQMARKLMSKHGIELSELEIEEEKQEDDTVVDQTVFETKKKGILTIGGVIANNFKCKMYYVSGSPMRIQFVGRPFDVSIAKETLTYALIVSKKLCKKTIDNMKKRGESTRGAEQDYFIGFSRGLKACFEEQNKQEGESFELSLQTPVVVTDYMSKLNLTKPKTIRTNGSQAYASGYNDGVSFKVKKIE